MTYGPSHDTKSELRARHLLDDMKIPYSTDSRYTQFKRDEWICTQCTLQSDLDSANRPDPNNTELVICKRCNIEMQRMIYEIDAILFPESKIDALECDGDVHLRGKTARNDPRRQVFLEKRYHLRFHRFPNDVLLKYPEIFVQYVELLRELREKK